MIFSLILATYGRSDEIENLFHSLTLQTLDTDTFEIIVVDQNDKIDLSEIISSYSERLTISHIKSSRKGLSLNRNIGLKLAKGNYICFPDDDCTYYPDTLEKALFHLKEKNVTAVFGAILDRDTGEDIIRNWPTKNKKITRHNFFNLYSSITIFTKKNEVQFNEALGVGCYFGSYEDSEYVYNLVRKAGECFYFKDIQVWHPKIGIQHFSKEKNISYGLGFGAFCSIHKFDIFIMRLFFMALAYHLSFAVFSVFKGDFLSANKRINSFTSRIKGFFEHTFTRN